MKHADLIQSIVLDGIKYELYIANCSELRKQSYQFIYSCYIKNNLGMENPYKMWFSKYELLPTSITVLLKREGRVVASVSVIMDSEYGIPADNCFVDYLDTCYRSSKKLVAEVYSLSVNKEENNPLSLLTSVFNCVSIIGYYYFKVDYVIITVTVHHTEFYKKKLCFFEYEKIGFHEKTGVECKFLYHQVLEKISDNIPLCKKTLFEKFLDPESEKNITESLINQHRSITLDQAREFYDIKRLQSNCQ